MLSCLVSIDVNYDLDLGKKISLFQSVCVCGTIISGLENTTRRDTLLKFYKVMSAPDFLHGCATCVTRGLELRMATSVYRPRKLDFSELLEGINLLPEEECRHRG